MISTPLLLTLALSSVAVLLWLVMVRKMPVFIALLLVSVLMGLGSGMSPKLVLETLQAGMAGTLGFIAVVVGLGAIFGEVLNVSGGARQLAETLLARWGESKAPWGLSLAGFLIAIPVFFDVGFVILAPLIYGLSKRSGKSLLYYAIPLLAGLAVTHSFVPPTPGPVAVASILGADLGWVIFFGAICGSVAMVCAGPVFGTYIGNKIYVPAENFGLDVTEESADLPPFSTVMFLVAVPLVLIVLNTVSGLIFVEGHWARNLFQFVGHPFIALIIATLACLHFLGTRRGVSRQDLNRVATRAFEPAGIIILVTGAGGVFKQVLIESGVGQALGEALANSQLPLIVAAFFIATLVRVVQGSATVSMITAAGLMAPIVQVAQVSPPKLALIVVAIASGATVLSHVNDSGFWLVSRYLGLSEKQTLASWTVMETIIGSVGFGVALLLSLWF